MVENLSQPLAARTHTKSRWSWFLVGVVFGILIFAGLNAVSYAWRSAGWGRLIGIYPTGAGGNESLGFPFEIWSAGKTYRRGIAGTFVDQNAFAINSLIGLLLGCLLGIVCWRSADWLNRFLDSEIARETVARSEIKLQFSLKGLLVVTAIAAILAAVARQAFGPRPELLGAIYLSGPLFLILLAMIPKNATWQARVVMLIPSTILLVAFAAYIGNKLGIQFDRVMMAIYICWVPQTVIAAICITIGQAVRFSRNLRQQNES